MENYSNDIDWITHPMQPASIALSAIHHLRSNTTLMTKRFAIDRSVSRNIVLVNRAAIRPFIISECKMYINLLRLVKHVRLDVMICSLWFITFSITIGSR